MERKWVYVLGVSFASVLWGVNFGVSRLGMETFPPALFVFLRFGLAVPVLFAILKIVEGSVTIRKRDLMLLMLLGAMGVTLLEMLVLYSIEHTTLANASLLNVAPWPIFVALFSPWFKEEKSSLRVYLGGCVAMIGVALVILGGSDSGRLSSEDTWGNLAAFSVSILGALMNLMVMQLMRRYSALRINTWLFLFGTLFLFPFTIQDWHQVQWTSLGMMEGFVVLYNVLFCTVIAFYLWNHSMKHLGATVSNFFRYLVPVAAVITGVWMYQESITLWQMLGTISMLLGLFWVSGSRKKALPKASL